MAAFSDDGHPKALGSALTHKWITTDFAEALLEFITRWTVILIICWRYCATSTARNMGDERMWRSACPAISSRGRRLNWRNTSNIGRLKTLYREGHEKPLRRVDADDLRRTLQLLLPMAFWQANAVKRIRMRSPRVTSA